MRALATQLIEAHPDHKIACSDVRRHPQCREPASPNSWGSLFNCKQFAKVEGVVQSEIADRHAGINLLWTVKKHAKAVHFSVDFRKLAEDTVSILQRKDYRNEEIRVNLEILVSWIEEWLFDQQRNAGRIAPVRAQTNGKRHPSSAEVMADLLGATVTRLSVAERS